MAISYQIEFTESAQGQGLEAVVVGAAAPTSGAGFIELRIDQTATAITDAQSTTGTRTLKKGEVVQMLNYLIQYLLRDPNVTQ